MKTRFLTEFQLRNDSPNALVTPLEPRCWVRCILGWVHVRVERLKRDAYATFRTEYRRDAMFW
jgi:hypothetical protein